MHQEFNELNIGNVIQLDRTIYTYGVSASGHVVMIGQYGDQNDSFEFQESKEYLESHLDEFPPIVQAFGFSCHPLPFGKIGQDAKNLHKKNFVIISTRPDGMPEEEMHHTGFEQSESGQMVMADEIFINEYGESNVESDAVRLRVMFYQGQGYDHLINFPTVIGEAPVERTYTIGSFSPL